MSNSNEDPSLSNDINVSGVAPKTIFDSCKRPSAPLPPRWRFVNDAKKSYGYSTADAGRKIQGFSAEELAAKYNPPVIEGDKNTVKDLLVGKLEVRETEKEELVLPSGDFPGFHQPKEEESGVGIRQPRELSFFNDPMIEGAQDSEPIYDSSLQSEIIAQELHFDTFVHEFKKDPDEELESVLKDNSNDEFVPSKQQTAQPLKIIQERSNDMDSLSAQRLAEMEQQQISVIVEKSMQLQTCENNAANLQHDRRKCILLFLLLFVFIGTLIVGVILGAPSRRKGEVDKLKAVEENFSNSPSISHSDHPSILIVPSLSPTFSCPTNTSSFSLKFVRHRDFEGLTIKETSTNEFTWTLRDACSGAVILGCLPCKSLLAPVHDRVKLSDTNGERESISVFYNAVGETLGCLPSRIEYSFEVKKSEEHGTCCGFPASEYIVMLNDVVVAKNHTDDVSVFSTNTSDSNYLSESITYFGSTNEPCLTSSPSEWYSPSLLPSLKPSKVISTPPSVQPSSWPSLQLFLPTSKPTCSYTNKDFNVCLAIDMSGSVCNRATGFECIDCEPALICNADDVSQGMCCNNFFNVVEFAALIVTSLSSLPSTQHYSIVSFATNATMINPLTSSVQVLNSLDKMIFTGGLTNHAEAINTCQKTLTTPSNEETKSFIIIITDGYPSEPKGSPDVTARQAADAAKQEGSFIIPILIAPTLESKTHDFMKSISSDGSVFTAIDFNGLPMLEEMILSQVSCQV